MIRRVARAVCLLPLILTAPAFAAAPERSPTPATDAATYRLAPEKYAQAVAYSRARYRLHFVGVAWGLLVVLGLLALRVAPRLRDFAEKRAAGRLSRVLLFVPPLLLLQGVLELPLAAYRHALAVRYGQSVQGWASWLGDQGKGAAVGLIIAVPTVLGLYAIIRRSPRRWWILSWLAVLPFTILMVFLAPILIDPLFYEFRPLSPGNPGLARRIEEVTRRGGLEIPPDRMFEMEASAKRRSVNAYVTGIGASKRVVVWDTTIQRMTTDQTVFVFGHEMGHYVLRHVPKGIAFFSAVLAVLFFAGSRAAADLQRRFGPRWGIRELSDWASLPLLQLVLGVGLFLAEPVFNAFSRFEERQADVYALEVIHGVVPDSSRVAPEAFQVLGEINLSDPSPGPFVRFWLYSHPPIAERVRFARTYDPWGKGETPRFVR